MNNLPLPQIARLLRENLEVQVNLLQALEAATDQIMGVFGSAQVPRDALKKEYLKGYRASRKGEGEKADKPEKVGKKGRRTRIGGMGRMTMETARSFGQNKFTLEDLMSKIKADHGVTPTKSSVRNVLNRQAKNLYKVVGTEVLKSGHGTGTRVYIYKSVDTETPGVPLRITGGMTPKLRIGDMFIRDKVTASLGDLQPGETFTSPDLVARFETEQKRKLSYSERASITSVLNTIPGIRRENAIQNGRVVTWTKM